MSYPCVLCDQQVRPRQHALQCEDCDKWQHRLCSTGISITDYRLMVNEEVDIIFHCAECVRNHKIWRLSSLVSHQDRFPTAEINGCSFHWWRKVAELGLKTAYDSKKSVHLFIRKLLALPYLPSDHIRPAFYRDASNHCNSLTTDQAADDLPSTYLVQQHSLDCSTVVCPSALRWHRRFNGKAAHNHLHFYKIVPFQQEAKTVSITQQLVSEQQLSRYQRDTYKQLQGRLTSLWDQYEEDSIRTPDFLRSVGHLIVPQPETLPESDSEDSDYEFKFNCRDLMNLLVVLIMCKVLC
ncbi:unnamed protein product [Mytilus coruscus]|uniref:PHD-type domain-containing protein n=1 Tax=Mytilus coruscus TaxID=42192 RepID=A0A6J8DEX3_MYTCO|nr:unnamed protein product [Mytilus coruscus]